MWSSCRLDSCATPIFPFRADWMARIRPGHWGGWRAMVKKILLGEADIPERWYNILPDLPAHPATLPPIFPQAIIAQEVSAEPWIEIPEEVRDVYKIWRPSPLYRAERLEEELDTTVAISLNSETV